MDRNVCRLRHRSHMDDVRLRTVYQNLTRFEDNLLQGGELVLYGRDLGRCDGLLALVIGTRHRQCRLKGRMFLYILSWYSRRVGDNVCLPYRMSLTRLGMQKSLQPNVPLVEVVPSSSTFPLRPNSIDRTTGSGGYTHFKSRKPLCSRDSSYVSRKPLGLSAFPIVWW
jgi:hypothetical protein